MADTTIKPNLLSTGIDTNSQAWKNYVSYVLGWEGHHDTDPNDSASGCVGHNGSIHTTYGVTFCDWTKWAVSLGQKADHDSFVNMSTDTAGLFMLKTAQQVVRPDIPMIVILALTEIYWGGGPGRVMPILDEALVTLNVFGHNDHSETHLTINDAGAAAIRKVEAKVMVTTLWQTWRNFLIRISQPGMRNAIYRKGWLNRNDSFIQKFISQL